MKKRFQAAKRAARNKVSLRKACALLHVNRSSVYKSLKPSKKALDDDALAEKMKAIQAKHKWSYGVERMTGELLRPDAADGGVLFQRFLQLCLERKK